jgi:hypothetical protein
MSHLKPPPGRNQFRVLIILVDVESLIISEPLNEKNNATLYKRGKFLSSLTGI